MSGSDNSRDDEVARLRDELHARLVTLRQLATSKVVDSTKKAAAQLEGSAEKIATTSTQALGASLDDIEMRVHQTIEAMDPRPAMSEHPKTTLLASFAAGVLVAMRPQRSRPSPLVGLALELAIATAQAEFFRRAQVFAQRPAAKPAAREKVPLPAIDVGTAPEV